MRVTVVVVLVALGLGAKFMISALSHIGIHRGYAPEQPIAFPHKVHAGDNQIPCLYCHFGARTSRHAGIPSASICMNCHGMLEKQTTEIEKLEEAVQLQRPIVWVKVHNLPDFVYFNHSRHVLSGVDCSNCHGQVEQMDRVQQVSPLTMGWCLDCHRKHEGIPTESLKRATWTLAHDTAPTPGLDCSSCHY
jgi:hypothetical protein